MKPERELVKIIGDDVENHVVVTYLEPDVIEIDGFRGQEKHYTMIVKNSTDGNGRKRLRRIGTGTRFQVYD